jgi:DNA-binding NtrC family response regulator
MPLARVLVVGGSSETPLSLARLLGTGHEVLRARDAGAAAALLPQGLIDVVLVDLDAGAGPALEAFRSIAEIAPASEVVVVARRGSPADATRVARQGLWELLVPPLEGQRLALATLRALDRHRLREQVQELRCDRRASAGPSEVGPRPFAPADSAPVANLLGLRYRRAVDLARDRVSREYLAALLREVRGNVTRAAVRAGLERETLHRLLKRYQVLPGPFRPRRTRADTSHSDGLGYEPAGAHAGSSYSASSSADSDRPMLASSE